MSQNKKSEPNKIAGRSLRLAVLTFVCTMVLIIPLQLAAQSTLLLSVVLLLFVTGIGILADMVGVAAALALPAPFNAMGAKKIAGARHGLCIIRNVGIVSSYLCDFVGDIVGTVTGALGVSIVFSIGVLEHAGYAQSLAVAAVAAFTVGGKSVGKHYAVRHATEIVLRAGQMLHWLERQFGIRVFGEGLSRQKGK